MTKFVLLAGLVVQTAIKSVNAVDCYVCNSSLDADAGSLTNVGVSCWDPTTTDPTDGTATVEATGCDRCRSEVTLADGFPIMISRTCDASGDQLDSETYGTTTCEASTLETRDFFGEDDDSEVAQVTVCKEDCSSDNCNDDFKLTGGTVSGLTMCPQIDTLTGKWCDLTDGIWKCNDGLYPDGERSKDPASPSSDETCEVDNDPLDPTYTFFSCVQCNSMTDPTCYTKTDVSACDDPNTSQNTCFSTSSIIYDRHTGSVLFETVVKGCSNRAETAINADSPDQCFWSSGENTLTAMGSDTFFDEKDSETSVFDQAIEYACTKNCLDSGCNTDVPNGVVEEAEQTIYCAVYDSTDMSSVKQDTDFSGMTQACPAGTTSCYSSVTYLLRDNNQFLLLDVENEEHSNGDRTMIIEQKRGCWSDASAVTETICSMDADYSPSSNVAGVPVTKHTCTETCEGNYCNGYKWPNRPMCLRTSQNAVSLAEGLQFGTRYVGNACESPAEDTCYIAQYNFLPPTSHYYRDQSATEDFRSNGDDIGFETSISRGCTISEDKYFETGCMKQGVRGTGALHKNEFFESCNFTCTNTGCNWGSAYSSSLTKLFSPILILVALAARNM